MFKFAGQTSLWNHPVGQSQYALANLNSYRLTGDKRYLQIAERNAQRLIDRRFVSDTAWFYPYDFDFTLFGDTTQTLRAPWYSAMAQGQALSAFVRLYQVTGKVSWLDAADATFQSLLVTPADSAPFASRVDEKGHLWFEEYPRYPVNTSEQVLNGHIFALFGLHDYWSLTQNTDAHLLYLGGLKTVEDTVLTEFRRPNWASVYSLGHKIPTLSYHFIHTDQFLQLWKQTRQPFFIQAASTFRSDYPRKRLTGRVIITSKVRTLWKVNSSGVMTSSRSVVFSRVSGAPWNFRQRIKGGAVGLLISKGPYQGWYVQEKVGVAWSLGAIDVHRYGPAATLQFSPRRFTAYRLGTNGKIVSSKQVSILRVSNAPTSMSAIVQGRPAWYVSKGSLAGYWVPMQSGVSLVS